jgi:hypothetical protein
MAGSRIVGLTAIAGVDTANDDDLIIFDADADATKRISRSQFAIALSGDLPFTAGGTLDATTLVNAVLELETDLDIVRDAQGYTKLKTATSTAIAAATNAINTTGKTAGRTVYDTTNNRMMISSGSAATSPWYVADGSVSVIQA